MGFIFEDLHAYQKGLELAEKIRDLKGDHKTAVKDLLDQIRRASASIPINLAEGSGRYHPREKRQFYRVARGSINECVPIIKLLWRKRILDETSYMQLRNDLEVVAKMITSLIASVG